MFEANICFKIDVFCNLSNVNPLQCVSINNQKCKVRLEIIILLVLKQVNVLVFVIILVIPMQNCVFLMLLKI